MRKTSGEPKESHAKDGKTSMVAGAGGKEPRKHGAMATRACAMRLDASTNHKRDAVAWEGIAERKNGHGNMWSMKALA